MTSQLKIRSICLVVKYNSAAILSLAGTLHHLLQVSHEFLVVRLLRCPADNFLFKRQHALEESIHGTLEVALELSLESHISRRDTPLPQLLHDLSPQPTRDGACVQDDQLNDVSLDILDRGHTLFEVPLPRESLTNDFGHGRLEKLQPDPIRRIVNVDHESALRPLITIFDSFQRSPDVETDRVLEIQSLSKMNMPTHDEYEFSPIHDLGVESAIRDVVTVVGHTAHVIMEDKDVTPFRVQIFEGDVVR